MLNKTQLLKHTKTPAQQDRGRKAIRCALCVGLVGSFALGCATSTALFPPTSPAHTAVTGLTPEAAQLTKNADQLLAALIVGDIDTLSQMRPPNAEDTDPQTIEILRRSLQRMGPILNREIEQIKYRENLRLGLFRLTFKSATADLAVVTANGKIVGWTLDGEDIEKQIRVAYYESITELTVVKSALFDSNGEQQDESFYDGEKLRVALMIAGFERRTNFAHLRLNVKLRTSEGEVLSDERVLDNSVRFNTNEVPTIILSAFFSVKKPGRYTVELEVEDVYGSTTVTHARDLRIRSKQGSAFSKAFMAPQ